MMIREFKERDLEFVQERNFILINSYLITAQ